MKRYHDGEFGIAFCNFGVRIDYGMNINGRVSMICLGEELEVYYINILVLLLKVCLIAACCLLGGWLRYCVIVLYVVGRLLKPRKKKAK